MDLDHDEIDTDQGKLDLDQDKMDSDQDEMDSDQDYLPSSSEASFCTSNDDDDSHESDEESLEKQSCSRKKLRQKKFTKPKNAKRKVQKSKRTSAKKKQTNTEEKNAAKNKNKIDLEWVSGQENENVNNVPPFKGKFKININGSTPYNFFNKIFPEEIINIICTETNCYAKSLGDKTFLVVKKDIEIFLGINIVMTYIKYPSIRMYWSSEKGLGLPFIADAMSRDRFMQIKKYIHLVNLNDLTDIAKADKYFRVRPILDILHKTFHESVDPPEHQSIDEMLIPFKGRSGLKQYLKKKPKKWGFKVWVRASPNGYVHCFETYQSSQSPRSTYGPIGDSVINISHGLEDKNHKLFIDNLFTGYELLKYFTSKKIYVIGTLQLNRFPGIKEHLVELKKNKLSRGSTSLATSKDNITAVRWFDNKEVHTASTYAGVEPTDLVRRWDKKTKSYISVSRPFAIGEYNKYMGGVDLNDRMVAHYPHGFKNKKWYLRIFYHFLNVALVNSWICYKEKVEEITFLEFKSSVANALIYAQRPKKRGRPAKNNDEDDVSNLQCKRKRATTKSVSLDIRFDSVGHYPTKTNSQHASRCKESSCTKKTRYLCKKCDISVCPECMEKYHTEE